jgi:hypothetical protein
MAAISSSEQQQRKRSLKQQQQQYKSQAAPVHDISKLLLANPPGEDWHDMRLDLRQLKKVYFTSGDMHLACDPRSCLRGWANCQSNTGPGRPRPGVKLDPLQLRDVYPSHAPGL